MNTTTVEDYLRGNPVAPGELARAVEGVRQYVRAYKLREVREAQAMTQVELAQDLGVGQSQVSQIEHGEIGRSKVDTLRRYVEALGGELDVQVRFGDTRYVLA